MPRAVAGLEVIDATHVPAGPFAARQLAVLGAEVIRIDNPDAPGQPRRQGPDAALNLAGLNLAGMGTTYLAQGANKRPIALDLKTAGGQKGLKASATSAAGRPAAMRGTICYRPWAVGRPSW